MPDTAVATPATTQNKETPGTKNTKRGNVNNPTSVSSKKNNKPNNNNVVNFAAATETIEPLNNGTPSSANHHQQQQQQLKDARPKLYKSSRMKGYITLILASVINYSAARNSGLAVNAAAVGSTSGQRAYVQAAAMTSCVICIVIFAMHIDQWSPFVRVWEKAFGDGKLIELLIVCFLVVWWTVATAVVTTVRGIAGDGKGQYNLYYSTWCCCWTSYWTLERWLVSYGWASFKSFISSWPFRAPGWIAIFGFSFCSLMSYLDLYSNHDSAAPQGTYLYEHYQKIGQGQWQWLLFVGSFSLLPSLVFIVIELFRETTSDSNVSGSASSEHHPSRHQRHLSFSVAASTHQSPRRSMALPSPRYSSSNSPLRESRSYIPSRQNPLPEKGSRTGGKGPLENILEGFCLVLMVCAWIPTVVVATIPGGAASLIGNAYFFTWINTVFVMETFIWFVHDLRKGVHSALQVKEREYQKRQQEVLQKSRALEGKRRMLQVANLENEPEDDISLDMPFTVRPTMLGGGIVGVGDDGISLSQRPSQQQQQQQNQQQHPVFDLSTSHEEDTHANNSSGAMVMTTEDGHDDHHDNDMNDQDPKQNFNHVRRQRQAVNNLNVEDPEIPLPPVRTLSPMSDHSSPQGSTVFFEAASSPSDEFDVPF